MNIAIVSYAFSSPSTPALCGPALCAYHLAKGLSRYATVHVFYTEGGSEPGGPFIPHRLPAGPMQPGKATLRNLLAFDRLAYAALCKEGPFDIVATHGWLTSSAQRYKTVSGARWVHTLHAVESLRLRSLKEAPATAAAMKSMESGLPQADALIAVSKKTAAEAIAACHIPMEKMAVITSGVDHTLFRPGKKENTVLFAGRLSAEKGVDLLISVARLVLRQRPHTRFLILAPSSRIRSATPAVAGLHASLVALKQEFPHQVAVITRPLPQTSLAPYYARSSVFLLPSAYEAFGLAALEAMAAGAVVVSSAAGGITELINRENGVVVERTAESMAAATLSLLSNPEKLRSLSANAEKTARRFSWDTTVEKTLALYKKLLDNKKVPDILSTPIFSTTP